MPLMIRRIALDDTLDHHLCLEALARVISPAVIDTVLQECGSGERRTRKLPSVVTLLFCIAMNLYADYGLAHVYRRLVLGLRWI